MQRSTDRILTTHAGSLPRDDDLAALIRKKAQNEAVDEGPFAARVQQAVNDVVNWNRNEHYKTEEDYLVATGRSAGGRVSLFRNLEGA